MSIRRAAAWLRSCPMRIRRWACASHLAVIALLSLLPAWLFPPSIAEIPGIDKWMHLAMYGVFGALLRWVAGQGPLSPAARACSRIRQVSVAELLAETIRRIAFGESVSSLYVD